MTCIVAIEHNGEVWMGADSSASKNDDIICTLNDKIFINDEFIIGYSGSFRIGQIIQYAFTPPKQNIFKQSDMQFMVVDFVDALRNIFREKGVLINDHEGDAHDSELLVGYHGKIYTIERDFHVEKPLKNYAACGSGMTYALGAMFAMNDEDFCVKKKIEKALEASFEYSVSVRPPFVIKKL